MLKPNYELKAQLINEGTYLKDYRKIKKSEYFWDEVIISNDGEISDEKLEKSKYYYSPGMIKHRKKILLEDENGIEKFKECERIINADSSRACRSFKFIRSMLDKGLCIFGTLSFTNDVLNSTSLETRRRYVARFLKSVSNVYIANIDYGDKEKNPDSNEREHYHCVILLDYLEPTSWHYGFAKFKRVIVKEDSVKRLGNYVAKRLTNHAIKETTKRNHMIYSRKTNLV